MTTKVPDSLLVSGGGGGGGGGGDMFKSDNLAGLPNITAARSNLGLGSLATQNGTFSGTHSGNSSGTNTGDQVISDATISTSDVTTNNASTTKHGFLPKLSGVNTQFLDGTGTWSTPAGGGGGGGGDMFKSDNLAGLANVGTARSNLGLGSLATQNGTFSGSSSGTNTGDQTITLTGDVTGSGIGSFSATIGNDVVSNAKLANMATKTYKGRTSGSTGDPEDVPVATLKSDLSLTKSDVGLSNVDNTADASKTVLNATQWNGHNITVSASAPSGGSDGDIWFQYTP